MAKPFVIYTASDAKYGDFLIDHWLRSLRASVDLSKIDVRVLDFGLTTAQRYYLEHESVGVRRCLRNGHVAVVRFREMAQDLREHSYEQVLAVDGGDVIFQGDVAPLFEAHQPQFRAVPEDLISGFDIFLTETFFSRETIDRIRRTTALRPQINAGFLLGPRDAFLTLCEEVDRLVLDKSAFGPDQLVVNMVLHSRGYVALPCGFNFVLATARRRFLIENGVFIFEDTLRPIPVVHNAGNWKFLRPIEDFGWGSDHNKLKRDVLATLHLLHHSSSFLKATDGRIRRLARSAWDRTFAS